MLLSIDTANTLPIEYNIVLNFECSGSSVAIFVLEAAIQQQLHPPHDFH
jgi:hypothetical protein